MTNLNTLEIVIIASIATSLIWNTVGLIYAVKVNKLSTLIGNWVWVFKKEFCNRKLWINVINALKWLVNLAIIVMVFTGVIAEGTSVYNCVLVLTSITLVLQMLSIAFLAYNGAWMGFSNPIDFDEALAQAIKEARDVNGEI